MSKNKNLKLFLLSSIDYRNGLNKETRYIDSMLAITRAFGEAKQASHAFIEGNSVFYHESEDTADTRDISTLDALTKARGLTMAHVTAFSASVTDVPPAHVDQAVVREAKSRLFYDSHACFLVITEVCIGLDTNADVSSTVRQIFEKRSSFENLGLKDYMAQTFEQATSAVLQILHKASASTKSLSDEHVGFSEEKTLPLLMSGESFQVDLRSFRNEEISAQITQQHAISQDYPGAFFHPGWNYTIVAGFPHEVLVNTLHMMIRAQTFFFSLGYMKGYFSNELNLTLKQKIHIGEKEVDNAEEVRLAFYDLLAKFKSYKNQLFPKYHAELCALMDRWHCYDDVDYIKGCIELNLQAKDRIHNNKVEKQNERQNNALAFIAFLQLISIYGAFADGNNLFSEETWLFHLGTVTLVLSLTAFLVLCRYIKTAVAFGFFSALTMAVIGQIGLWG